MNLHIKQNSYHSLRQTTLQNIHISENESWNRWKQEFQARFQLDCTAMLSKPNNARRLTDELTMDHFRLHAPHQVDVLYITLWKKNAQTEQEDVMLYFYGVRTYVTRWANVFSPKNNFGALGRGVTIVCMMWSSKRLKLANKETYLGYTMFFSKVVCQK